jgi:hypothetical protein
VNFLQSISQCCSLCLHGNPSITSFREIQKLEMLKNLQKLTLHGATTATINACSWVKSRGQEPKTLSALVVTGGAFDQLPHYRQRLVMQLRARDHVSCDSTPRFATR